MRINKDYRQALKTGRMIDSFNKRVYKEQYEHAIISGWCIVAATIIIILGVLK